MADVFVSYAREDRDRARKLAEAFEASGWSVWWDRRIVTGESFDQTIERELERAKSVVVLWSNDSITSEWVKNEAAVASERGVLVPALIDNVKIPLEFRRRQTANLIDWSGDPAHEGFVALHEGVAARLGAPVRAPDARPPHRGNLSFWWRRHWRSAAIAAVIAVVAASGVWVVTQQDFELSRTAGGTGRDVPDRGSSSSDGVTVAPPDGNDIDHPAALPLGVTHKVTLEHNEEYYFRLTAQANAIRIVQDVRPQPRQTGNLQTELSILDEAGAVVMPDVIHFNEIDFGYRKAAMYSAKRPSRLGFKLVNVGNLTQDVWLTVSAEGASHRFLPFFGEIVPQPLMVGRSVSGSLDRGEEVFFVVQLPRGDYRATLDFANAKRDHTNLAGYLAVLDADGDRQERIIRMNVIEVSYRELATFPVLRDGSTILRLQNTSAAVNFTLQIAPAE